MNEAIDVNGSLDVTVAAYPEFDDVMAKTRARRPEIFQLQHRIAAEGENVTISRGYNKPRLDFQSMYGFHDLSYGETNADGNAWSLGIFMTYPIFDSGKTKGLVMQAESQCRSLELDMEKLNDTLELQVRQAVNAVREAGEIVNALHETVAQAEKLLFMAEKGYEFGAMTRLDVEDAELNLKQAHISLSRGRRDYLVAQVTLAWVMGVTGEDR
ncbi:MAG: TolC family protein [Desulfobacteraceae bacterium]|nr:TolC family protein [Desulfobacteraceae bacterium]